jgi:hypothetical protein
MVGTSPTMTMKAGETPHPSPLPQGERGRIMRGAFAQARGGAGIAPRPEGTLVQALDRRGVARQFLADGEGKRGHDGGKPADGQRLGK